MPPPRPNSSGRGRPAFTLFEILAVLALIGLVAGIVVANTDAMFSAFVHPSPENAVRRAFSAARRKALDTHGPVTFVLKNGTVRLRDHHGEEAGSFPVVENNDDRSVALIADDGAKPSEATPLEQIRFTPEGTVNPVRVRLSFKTAQRVRVWRADPLSAVLTEEVAHD